MGSSLYLLVVIHPSSLELGVRQRVVITVLFALLLWEVSSIIF